MANISVNTTIRTIERNKNSHSGAPNFKLTTDDGIFTTENDAQVNWQISSYYENKPVKILATSRHKLISLQEIE